MSDASALAPGADRPSVPAMRHPRVRRRYHPHLPGFLYIVVTLFLALGAINGQNNLLFAALGCAIGGLLVSGLLSGNALLGVAVHRRVAGDPAVGNPVTLTYAVSNANRWTPAFGLLVHEAATDDLLESVPMAQVTHIGPRETVEADAVLVPRRRGRLTLDRAIVSSTFPFGMVRKSIELTTPSTLIVRPPTFRLARHVLDAIFSHAEGQRDRDQWSGEGEEFYGVRDYIPGDTQRSVAWKPTARRGSIVVRQTMRPGTGLLRVVLRLTDPALDEVAIALAASIVRAAHRHGCPVAMHLPGVPRAGRSGTARLSHWLDALALLDTDAARADRSPAPLDPRARVVTIEAGGGTHLAGRPARLDPLHADRLLDLDDASRAVLASLATPPGAEPRRRRRRRREGAP